MGERDSLGIGIVMLLAMVMALFFMVRADYYYIRDLQRRVAELEQKK